MKSFTSLLTELTKPSALGYLRSQPATPDINSEFISWFRANTKLINDVMNYIRQTDQRFKTAGAGAFGKVFSSDDYPFVIKVFVTNSAAKGYQKWLSFCYANQDNPYVPKIRGRHVTISKHHNIAAVRIEKLLPLDRTTAVNFMQYMWDVGRGEIEDQHLSAITRYIDSLGPSDLGRDNIMMRSNGQIVIIDPIAG